MRTHTQLRESLTEPSVSYPVVTHDRKGREGKGDRRGSGSLIHASSLTGPLTRPVDNAGTATTPDRLGWMGRSQ